MEAPRGNPRDEGRRGADRSGSADRDRFEQLVELAPDGILVHDGERIVFANAAAVRLAGATERSQLLGLQIETFLDPPYLRAVEAGLIGSDAVTVAAPVRDRFRRLDDTVLDVEVTAIGFVDRDRPAVHLIVRDIGERLTLERTAQRAEEHLHQAQRMEAVGALAGGVAHEVNNMMTVVLGFSEFLLQDGVAPERMADVREIVKAAQRAASVTRQVLAFSRRAFHQPKVVDLGALVRGLELLVRRILGEGPRLILASDPGLRVWVDPAQLEQVIVNLALNARDAMPADGTLTIGTAELEVANGARSVGGATIPPGRYALLNVRDSGVGMDRETQANIFEPFFTTKPVGQGTGLGLAAASGIMKQNDGHISVTSAPGRGATFTLYLPLLPAPQLAESPVAPAAPGVATPRAGATILVVEDESAVREIAVRSLESGGFRVFQARDGVSALESIEQHGPPDLVLTDVIMPDMGGAELARRLGARWPALPILFMSGYSLEDLHRQGDLGVGQDIIQKPFAPAALAERVAAMLRPRATRPRRGTGSG